MRILLLDIETAPNVAHVWGLWQQNVGLPQIMASGYTLCWAAKWRGEREIHFDSIKKSSPKRMIQRIWRMVDEADVVVHYNGTKFDMPTLSKEFLQHDMSPPAPYKQVDLLSVVRRQFRFPSNKLDYVAQALELGKKYEHIGHELWVRCMAKDPEAWEEMEKYNRHDVKLLEALYNRVLPWITKHPNHGAYEDIQCCPKCGSESFQQRGHQVAQTYKYRRYQCQDCGGWFRGNKTVSPRISERASNIAA